MRTRQTSFNSPKSLKKQFAQLTDGKELSHTGNLTERESSKSGTAR